MSKGDPEQEAEEAAAAGLCAQCRHCRRVSSERGSLFYLCRLSESDPAFARYPVLPVRACRGFEPAREAGERGED